MNDQPVTRNAEATSAGRCAPLLCGLLLLTAGPAGTAAHEAAFQAEPLMAAPGTAASPLSDDAIRAIFFRMLSSAAPPGAPPSMTCPPRATDPAAMRRAAAAAADYRDESARSGRARGRSSRGVVLAAGGYDPVAVPSAGRQTNAGPRPSSDPSTEILWLDSPRPRRASSSVQQAAAVSHRGAGDAKQR